MDRGDLLFRTGNGFLGLFGGGFRLESISMVD